MHLPASSFFRIDFLPNLYKFSYGLFNKNSRNKSPISFADAAQAPGPQRNICISTNFLHCTAGKWRSEEKSTCDCINFATTRQGYTRKYQSSVNIDNHSWSAVVDQIGYTFIYEKILPSEARPQTKDEITFSSHLVCGPSKKNQGYRNLL